MSHELTTNGDRAEMAFTGALPWHGLGQRLDATASIAEWRTAAGMDWRIERGMVSTEALVDAPQADGTTVKTPVQIDVPDRVVLYRSDTRSPLSVVSRRFHEVQPEQALGFFKQIVEAGGGTMETAGTLQGGRRLWALVNTGQGLSLPGGDDVLGYWLLATACDGSMATTVRETSVRVVCANTLAMAFGERTQAITVRHSTRFDAERIQARLRKVSESFDAFAQAAETMARTRMDAAKAGAFLKALLPTPAGSKPVEETRGYLAIVRLFNGDGQGAGLASAAGTAWGMLNAVTEYVDHHAQARTQDNRLTSAWFGAGDDLKTRAAQLLAE